MTDGAEHDRNLLRTWKIVDARARLVDDLQRVHPHVAFGVPLGLLRAAGERLQLGKQFFDNAERHREREADRGPRRENQLLDFRPDPLGRKIVERNRAAQGVSRFIEREVEPGGELDRAQHAQAVVGERHRIDDAEKPAAKVAAAVEWVQVLAGERIPRDGVDGEIAAARGVLERQVRIPCHLEAAMAATRFRLAAGQRHIDVAGFINLKTATDGFDAPPRFEDLPQPLGGEAVHFDVDVLRLAAHQTVAHPAADDERAAARVADLYRDRVRALEWIRHFERHQRPAQA